jgi:hypothetical protein
MNTYAYVSSSPLVGVDPYGLWDIRDLYKPGDPGLVTGQTLGAAVAWAVGKGTHDDLLCEVAAEDLTGERLASTAMILMSLRGGGKYGGTYPRPAPGTRMRPPGVPQDWFPGPSQSRGGVKYQDPGNPHNYVRVEQGDPNSPFVNSRAPYVRDVRNGQYRDAKGNVVPKHDPAGHIPLKEYEYLP